MDYKQIAKDIYAESQKESSHSVASRYRKKALMAYSQDDRFYIRAHMDRIAKSNHVSGKSPASEFNSRQKS